MAEVVTGRAGTRSAAQVQAVIRQLVAELAPGDAGGLSVGSRLVDDLGYHSLALLELAFTVEDEFDLEPIDEQTAQGIVTVGDVETYVVDRLRERGALATGEE